MAMKPSEDIIGISCVPHTLGTAIGHSSPRLGFIISDLALYSHHGNEDQLIPLSQMFSYHG